MDTHDNNSTDVRTIKASEFKAKCLKLMDEVADSGTEIVINQEWPTCVASRSLSREESEHVWQGSGQNSHSRRHY